MAKKVLANGIDVSYAQGKIDWSKLKDKVDFAIIRCGFGGDYTNQDDSQWLNNVRGCEKYGIPYGVYLYSYATTVEKAKSEAKHVLRLIKGKKFDFPVFLDLEEEQIRRLGKAKILEISKTFCYEIEKAGYVFGTYSNKNWFTNYLTDPWYDSKIKWLAQYYKQVTYQGSYHIWQYSSSGKLDGIKCNVDLNRSYVSFLKGDVNGDGKVTADDARKILRASAKLEALSGQNAENADLDGDGRITAADARAALLKSAGVTE